MTPLKNIFPKRTPLKFAKDLNINPSTFYMYWYGLRRPTPKTAYKIINYLNKNFNIKLTLEEFYKVK